MAVPKISNDLENLYELKKNEFTKELNSDIQRLLDKFELNKVKEKQDITLRLDGRLKLVAECLMRGVTRSGDISKATGISSKSISHVCDSLKKKGFDVDYYKNKDPSILALRQVANPPSPQFKLQSDSNENQNNNPYKVVKND